MTEGWGPFQEAGSRGSRRAAWGGEGWRSEEAGLGPWAVPSFQAALAGEGLGSA